MFLPSYQIRVSDELRPPAALPPRKVWKETVREAGYRSVSISVIQPVTSHFTDRAIPTHDY
jgi:hypothetical protein